jgi:hypothetical protein
MTGGLYKFARIKQLHTYIYSFYEMEPEKPLVNNKYLLEKYPGKGGWTYAIIPGTVHDKHSPFGWVKVKGRIDNFEIKNYKLMPTANGLFLPVRAEVRKKIGKKEGDWVHVVLYADNLPTEIPDEFLDCLKEDPIAHKAFLKYTDGQQKKIIDWVYSAKTDDTKVERIAETLNKLIAQEKLRDRKQ